jgi:predicted tellurium resistance membrane protein TerC
MKLRHIFVLYRIGSEINRFCDCVDVVELLDVMLSLRSVAAGVVLMESVACWIVDICVCLLVAVCGGLSLQ